MTSRGCGLCVIYDLRAILRQAALEQH